MSALVRGAALAVGIEVGFAALIAVAGAMGGIAGKANASTFGNSPEYSHGVTCYQDNAGKRACATTCAYEDGNPDGRPCVWVDPDSGNAYLNDSANYRGATSSAARVGGALR